MVLKSRIESDPVFFECKDQIGYIVLNDPPENRMTLRFFQLLQKIVEEVKLAGELKGLILCSASRHFSSGADLMELTTALRLDSCGADHCNSMSLLDKNSECFKAISQLEVPVIAAIQGLCMGSAFELALCADMRIAEPHATVGLPEVEYGVMPGCGGTARLTKLTTPAYALEMILGGQLLSADEASEAGLVDKIVPRKTAVDEAVQIIENAYGRYGKASILKALRTDAVNKADNKGTGH